jgi:hypothetical protein
MWEKQKPREKEKSENSRYPSITQMIFLLNDLNK